MNVLAQAAGGIGVPPQRIPGLEHHVDESLQILRGQLRDIARSSADLPLILLQCGDLEAYGADMGNLAAQPFPGWDFWSAERSSSRPPEPSAGFHPIDVFGNHDVWPGTPLMHRKSNLYANVLAAMSQRPEFGGPIPDRTDVPVPGGRIEIYRFNTVHDSAQWQTLARGKVNRHLGRQTSYPLSGGTDPLDELECLVAQPSRLREAGDFAVRILVTHHPPHLFDWSPTMRLRVGRLGGAEDLAEILGERSIQLLIAGHRHAWDPKDGVELPNPDVVSSQPPLPAGVVQLVADTPTQFKRATASSFCVYTLRTVGSTRLQILRQIYTLRGRLDTRFTAHPVRQIAQLQLA